MALGDHLPGAFVVAFMTTLLADAHLAPPTRAPASDEDAALVARALGGDATAEAQIYRRHARPIAGLAARLVGSRTDAEDILQETFVLALEHLRDLRDPTALRPWLMRIAVTRCHHRLRRRRLLRWLGLDRTESDLSLDTMVSPSAGPEVQSELARIAALLARCPVPERVAWTLHRVEGETLEAVASTTGCSLATAKRRIAAVEARIEKHLHPKEPTP